MTQSDNNNADDTTIHHDEWHAAIQKAAPQNGELTAKMIRFLKDCRIPSELNNHTPLSYERIVPLWLEFMDSKVGRSTIRNRWEKIVREKL